MSPEKHEIFSTAGQRRIMFLTQRLWAHSPEGRNTVARPWEETKFPAGKQSANIWVIFLQEEMFELAYLFCFSSVCSLCLAGLGDVDLGFGAHLRAGVKSECARLEGNVLLVYSSCDAAAVR